MDIDSIIEGLTNFDGFPKEAVRAASANPEAVVPRLLDVIERYLQGELTPKTADLIFLGVHLLAEWREKAAYRPLVRLLRSPEEVVEYALGDCITETSHRVMAAVFDGDPQPLYDLILDPAADEYVRSRMCEAL